MSKFIRHLQAALLLKPSHLQWFQVNGKLHILVSRLILTKQILPMSKISSYQSLSRMLRRNGFTKQGRYWVHNHAATAYDLSRSANRRPARPKHVPNLEKPTPLSHWVGIFEHRLDKMFHKARPWQIWRSCQCHLWTCGPAVLWKTIWRVRVSWNATLVLRTENAIWWTSGLYQRLAFQGKPPPIFSKKGFFLKNMDRTFVQFLSAYVVFEE